LIHTARAGLHLAWAAPLPADNEKQHRSLKEQTINFRATRYLALVGLGICFDTYAGEHGGGVVPIQPSRAARRMPLASTVPERIVRERNITSQVKPIINKDARPRAMDVSKVATGGENCDLRKWPDGQPQRRPYAKRSRLFVSCPHAG
jgi:hypothetical protein